MNMLTVYTIQKISKQDKLYGPIHASMDANHTSCGKHVDHNWYILTNKFDGEITCQKCIAHNNSETLVSNSSKME